MGTRNVQMSQKWTVAVALVASLTAAGATAAELNTLTRVEVKQTPKGAQVVVAGSKAPTFTVFRMSDPDRLVVDVSSADASAVRGHHDGRGPVSGVVASQFSDDRASVARLLVALNHASQYDVRSDGTRVVISVDGVSAAPMTVATAAPAPEKLSSPAVEPKAAPAFAPVEKAQPTLASALPVSAPVVTPAQAEATSKGENVVATELDEREVQNPATRVSSLRWSRDVLQIRADGEIAKYELLELANPSRLALDVYGVSLAAKAPKVRSARVSDVRVGAHGGKVRVVLDVLGQMPRYQIRRLPNGLEVTLKGVTASQPAVANSEIEIDGQKVPVEVEAPVVAVKPAPAPAPKAEAPVVVVQPEAPALAEITDLTFRESAVGGVIELKLTRAARYTVDRPDGESAVLNLEGVVLPKRLERSLDASALETPIQMVSAFSVPGAGNRARVVVAASGKLSEKVSGTSKVITWKLESTGNETQQVAVAPKTAGFTTEAPRYAEEGAPQQTRRYSGKRVSFEFKDIDIHNLLRIIAEISKKNIVVADDVAGRVTIRLRNVPWDQALELILRSKGLGKEELGSIIRVAPLKALEEEAKLRAERRKAMETQEELVVQLIPVNYAVAKDMADRVKDVLTPRGSVTVDTRTNVMIVKDVASNINRARSLVQNLDTQTPQVLIESRIVEANTNFTREIGVQWGALAEASQAMGNPTGLIFPNNVSVGGGSQQTNSQGTADLPHWAVNLPAGVGQGSGGALGFHFGSAGGALQLNLRLSALENQGHVKTISAPKVATLDNNTARISQGISIPYTTTSQNGANTVFAEARLALEVTPHITQDGSILMAIKAENNQPDPSQLSVNGQPAIQRKEANTQVLVKDGDTTVIGGIYVRRGATSTAGIPLLSKIPLLGYLFRNESESDERQELLIFITPRILNRQTITQNL